MSQPNIAAKSPHLITLEIGKTYAWCACGNSKNQPFCDGSHKGTEFTPRVFTAEKEKAALCMCKHSGGAPFCDGTHAGL